MDRLYFRARPVILALLLLPVCAAAGCDKKDKKPASASTGKPAPVVPTVGGSASPVTAPAAGKGNEVTAHPAVLFDKSIQPAQFEVFGVKIGDARASLPPADVNGPPDESGWLGFKGHPNTFRAENDRIAEIHLEDAGLLSKLGISSESDLMQKFGPTGMPEGFGPGDPEVPFFIKDRWLRIMWSRKENKVMAINIGP